MIVRNDWIQELYLNTLIKGETHGQESQQTQNTNSISRKGNTTNSKRLQTPEAEVIIDKD